GEVVSMFQGPRALAVDFTLHGPAKLASVEERALRHHATRDGDRGLIGPLHQLAPRGHRRANVVCEASGSFVPAIQGGREARKVLLPELGLARGNPALLFLVGGAQRAPERFEALLSRVTVRDRRLKPLSGTGEPAFAFEGSAGVCSVRPVKRDLSVR